MEGKKINFSNKIYPIFYGLSADLIFWIAINTLFLTTVKHLNASQINTINFVGTFVAIFIQILFIKIIRKIGNVNSVKLGTVMLFLASALFTVANQYYLFFIAEILYACGFIFKQMDSVILMKNLKQLNKNEEYIKYQTRGSIIYSSVTFIISIFSGLLFNINNYIPMIFCMTVCFINIILSNFFYETKTSDEILEDKSKIKFSKTVILLIVLYGLFYASIAIGQTNSKLFMQYDMSSFLHTEQIAIYLSIILTLSRLSRIISNLLFIKVYNKLKNNIMKLLELILLTAFALMLIGHFVGNGIIGIIIMSLGFYLFLGIRDPFGNYVIKICFDNSKQQVHDKVIVCLSLSRKIGELFFSGVIAIILTKFSYVYVMVFMLIVAFLYTFIIKKINKLLKVK